MVETFGIKVSLCWCEGLVGDVYNVGYTHATGRLVCYWLISACAYFISGKKLCVYVLYALIICMRLLHVCAYYAYKKNVYYVYRDQRRLNITGLKCMRFAQQQPSTDLHTVACNLGKLNAGTKICASYYRARFALFTGTYVAACIVIY